MHQKEAALVQLNSLSHFQMRDTGFISGLTTTVMPGNDAEEDITLLNCSQAVVKVAETGINWQCPFVRHPNLVL